MVSGVLKEAITNDEVSEQFGDLFTFTRTTSKSFYYKYVIAERKLKCKAIEEKV